MLGFALKPFLMQIWAFSVYEFYFGQNLHKKHKVSLFNHGATFWCTCNNNVIYLNALSLEWKFQLWYSDQQLSVVYNQRNRDVWLGQESA